MFTVEGFFYNAWFSHGVSLKTTGTNNNCKNYIILSCIRCLVRKSVFLWH